MQKKIIAIITTGALFLSSIFAAKYSTSYASEESLTDSQLTVLALGDETMSAETSDRSAAELLGDYLQGTAKSDAESGLTTEALVAQLENDSTIQQDVREADIILVSVGMHDLMNAVFYENPYYPDASNCTTFLSLMRSADVDSAISLVDYVIDTLDDAVAEMEENLTASAACIQELNPDATVVYYTIQNPIAVDMNVLEDKGLSSNRIVAAQELRNFLHICLTGGTYTSPYYAAKTLDISTGINATIASLNGCAVADIYDGFYGASGEISLGFYLTNLENLDMTFTALGQVLLASAAIVSDSTLLCGEGSIITDAYDATGLRAEFSELRASLDTIIQLAESQVLPVVTTTEATTTTTTNTTAETTTTIITTATPTTTVTTAATTTTEATTTIPITTTTSTTTSATTTSITTTHAATTMTTTIQEITPPSSGDLDMDGDITIEDASLCLAAYANAAAGNDDGLDELTRIAADIDGDGRITIQDAFYILCYYAQSASGNSITWDDLLAE